GKSDRRILLKWSGISRSSAIAICTLVTRNKSQIKMPRQASDKPAERTESAQSTSGANLVYAGYPYDPYMPRSALPPKADMAMQLEMSALGQTRQPQIARNRYANITRNKLKYGYSKMR